MNREKLRIVFEKTGGRCWYCGLVLEPLGNWQVEHQMPRWGGGTDDLANLVPSCRGCNAAKGKRTVEEYRHSLLVKLENLITEASEMAGVMEDRVAWVVDSDFLADVPVPPGWLCKIQFLLHEAARNTVNARPRFYGEPPINPEGDIPAQRLETTA